MKKFKLAYGSGYVDVEVDEKDIIGELKGNTVPPIEEDCIKSALYASLDNPIGSRPLKEAVKGLENIVLVVSDMTRFWMRQDRIIPHVISYLNDCGIDDSRITVLIANGTHLPENEEERRTLVTDEIYERIRVVNHCCDSENFEYIGTTSFGTAVNVNRIAVNADIVICLGACTHHVMAGFGGGRKSILPGISSRETIEHNHLFSLDAEKFMTNPMIGNGLLRDNPVNEDMIEAAGMMKNLFMINLVCNASFELAYIYSGHYVESWLKACEAVNDIYRVPVDRQADVIITSAGGYPKDQSLYQGTKLFDNVLSGVKEGGKVIALLEARDGGGSPDYFDWSRHLAEGDFEEALRSNFTVGGYVFFLNCEQARKYEIYLYSDIDEEKVRPMGIHVFHDMDELLKAADIGGSSVYVIENGSTVIPYVR